MSILLRLLAVTLPLGAATAAAATLGPLSVGGLAAGSAPVGRCDTTFTVTYLAPPGATPGFTNPVGQVQIGDIAPPCTGGVLELVVVDAGGNALATSTAHRTITSTDYAGGQASVTVTLSATVEASAIDPATGTRLVIVGP